MKPSIASEPFQITPSTLALLEDCSEEAVYAPGYIQPHGVLVVLQPNLKILQVSENVEQFFGIAAVDLLGQPLQQLLTRSQVNQIAEFLLQGNLNSCNSFELKVRKVKSSSPSGNSSKARTRNFWGTLYRTAQTILLELEPRTTTERTHSLQFYHRLQTAILNFRSAVSLSDLAQTLAKEIKAITGFDRVMVYRFATDEHGVVIAEEKENHLESYLGLHYPATDIPAPARQLFYRNWVRQIPNVNAASVRLMTYQDALNDSACDPDLVQSSSVDLSQCVLRGVHPAHTEYLQNMGVVSSLTISLVDDQHLWGLISCHHCSPKQVDYETRKSCEFLGQFASIELVHQQERELNQYRTQVKAIQDNLHRAFLHEPNFIEQVLTRHGDQLLELVRAPGVAIVLDQQIALIGQTPSLDEVQSLVTWLPQLNQHEIYLTQCLARPYPLAKKLKHCASGILTISIVLQQKSYYLIWFRPEQIQTVNWAGNPHTAIFIDPSGEKHLTPRKSFELWKETVQEMSLPWEPAEVEAALMMRNTLMLAVLEFSQAALEQAAERAAIANRAKSQFLAKMSHELRTPLNAILGFTQVMARSPDASNEFQEHLGIISRSGEHLLSLINDVLEMSRIEAGQLVLTERHFNLHRMLRSVQDLFTLKAAQKGLILRFEIHETVPRYVCSDEAKLRQILINLISNAIKFTAQGSVTVQVSTTFRPPSRQTVSQGCACYPNSPNPCHLLGLSLAVTDTGCGIAVQDWESVFEAFMQTEQGRHAEGTGLGLSISRQFARLMQGDITVQSTVNRGSTFTCNVVLRQPEAISLVEPETAHPVIGLQPEQPTYRILVVEDFLENRQLLEALLQPIGFEIRAVENGVKAIECWQTWQPDLILMDIQMPVMNGYETTRQIRVMEQEQKTRAAQQAGEESFSSLPTKIVALTAYAFEDDRIASLQVGCDDYLAKPFTETALFEMLARHLGAQYRYANSATAASSALEQKALTVQDLNAMPPDWMIQVHEAALDLNDGKIRELITQISPQEQALINGMMLLVDNFQLEAIATLTQR